MVWNFVFQIKGLARSTHGLHEHSLGSDKNYTRDNLESHGGLVSTFTTPRSHNYPSMLMIHLLKHPNPPNM